MKITDFKPGEEFTFDYPNAPVFRCTDVGTRVAVAIKVDPVEIAVKDGDRAVFTKVITKAEAERDGWFDGPPYGVMEYVMDEDDMEICVPMENRDG